VAFSIAALAVPKQYGPVSWGLLGVMAVGSLERAIKRVTLALGVSVSVFTVAPGDVQSFDFSRYRPLAIGELVKNYPGQEGLAIVPDIPIRAKVLYFAEFRDLRDDSRRLIVAWAESMNLPRVPRAFQREMKISEAGIEYWVPVQEVLVPSLKAELGPGEEIELFMIYIGQVYGRHVLLVNEFEHKSPHRGRVH